MAKPAARPRKKVKKTVVDGAELNIRRAMTKSAMLVDMHPDLSREAVRYGRDHHHVNYSVFKQKLNKKSVLQKYNKVNNYGMVLKKLLAGKKHKMATAVNDLKFKL